MGLIPAALLPIGLIVALFVVATYVEAKGEGHRTLARNRHVAYVLALGVYCSSWTFYGAVGSAAMRGWNYLPIYLGPVLLLLLARGFLRRLSQAVAEEQATSISDFIATRFSHDIAVGRLVAVICLLGTIPYIALQLRSIGYALSFASGYDVAVPAMVAATIFLALFAVLFGIRRFEIAGRSEGLVFAIGLESLIKIVALASVAVFALILVMSMPAAPVQRAGQALRTVFHPNLVSIDTAVIVVISLFAVIVLPRQFYMGLVEARSPDDLARASRGLALYIAAMAAMAPAIALGGFALLPGATNPDLYVLALPMAAGNDWITAAALLGGISAAASMAIVDATALSTMVSNDLFLASVVRSGSGGAHGGFGRRILAIRRGAVAAVMVASLAWAMLVGEAETLASIGLIAFAAMAQFTPHLLMATYGAQRDPRPARASLTVGLALWLYTLALPPILPVDWLKALASTPLDPLNLFHIGSASPLVHGVFWSLGANLAVLALLSAGRIARPGLPKLLRVQRQVRNQQDLVDLVAGFVGIDRARQEFAGIDPRAPIDRRTAQFAQEVLARVVGAAPARALVASAMSGGTMSLAEVTRLLDEGGQSLRFSRQLLAATFENLDSGISVVDADMNLVAWNTRYLDMFDYPPGMVRVGAPIADLIRFNAERGDFGRGEFGEGDIEHQVTKRLAHMRTGTIHEFERERADGRVIKTVGGPMPGGGYVMSFIDVTEEARTREKLSRTLDELEHRVRERTLELSQANARLADSDREKTRFLAAASHDLLQPLHVARLFTSALSRQLGSEEKELAARIDESIVGAESLLRALLDISRIDAGGVVPQPERIELGPFLHDVAGGLRPLAEAKGLTLRVVDSTQVIGSDPGLLRSVVQNLVSNAIRYTVEGGIVIGVRRRGDHVGIAVADSGVGIAPDRQQEVFREFTRLGEVEAEGLGLGLALSRRIARLLGGEIELVSRPGHGSCFTLDLPRGDAGESVSPGRLHKGEARRAARSLRVLVVDDDARVVAATCAMLRGIGHEPVGATTIAEALACSETFDAVVADLHLADGETGIELIRALRIRRPEVPALIVTASLVGGLARQAAALGVETLAKPADPAAIERFLAAVSVGEIEP